MNCPSDIPLFSKLISSNHLGFYNIDQYQNNFYHIDINKCPKIVENGHFINFNHGLLNLHNNWAYGVYINTPYCHVQLIDIDEISIEEFNTVISILFKNITNNDHLNIKRVDIVQTSFDDKLNKYGYHIYLLYDNIYYITDIPDCLGLNDYICPGFRHYIKLNNFQIARISHKFNMQSYINYDIIPIESYIINHENIWKRTKLLPLTALLKTAELLLLTKSIQPSNFNLRKLL